MYFNILRKKEEKRKEYIFGYTYTGALLMR